MRYLIAIGMAVVFAALAALFLSSPVASWLVRQFTFDNPDSVAALHAATFMACNVAALVAGFLLGFRLGRRFEPQI